MPIGDGTRSEPTRLTADALLQWPVLMRVLRFVPRACSCSWQHAAHKDAGSVQHWSSSNALRVPGQRASGPAGQRLELTCKPATVLGSSAAARAACAAAVSAALACATAARQSAASLA